MWYTPRNYIGTVVVGSSRPSWDQPWHALSDGSPSHFYSGEDSRRYRLSRYLLYTNQDTVSSTYLSLKPFPNTRISLQWHRQYSFWNWKSFTLALREYVIPVTHCHYRTQLRAIAQSNKLQATHNFCVALPPEWIPEFRILRWLRNPEIEARNSGNLGFRARNSGNHGLRIRNSWSHSVRTRNSGTHTNKTRNFASLTSKSRNSYIMQWEDTLV